MASVLQAVTGCLLDVTERGAWKRRPDHFWSKIHHRHLFNRVLTELLQSFPRLPVEKPRTSRKRPRREYLVMDEDIPSDDDDSDMPMLE